ncbi:hypothetical protein J2797_005136 [Paraburkholderia terricola]|nr:hypothetical protein [Paraburkholderia terricola]
MPSADLGQQLEGYVAKLVETGRYRSLCIGPPQPSSAPIRQGLRIPGIRAHPFVAAMPGRVVDLLPRVLGAIFR